MVREFERLLMSCLALGILCLLIARHVRSYRRVRLHGFNLSRVYIGRGRFGIKRRTLDPELNTQLSKPQRKRSIRLDYLADGSDKLDSRLKILLLQSRLESFQVVLGRLRSLGGRD